MSDKISMFNGLVSGYPTQSPRPGIVSISNATFLKEVPAYGISAGKYADLAEFNFEDNTIVLFQYDEDDNSYERLATYRINHFSIN